MYLHLSFHIWINNGIKFKGEIMQITGGVQLSGGVNLTPGGGGTPTPSHVFQGSNYGYTSGGYSPVQDGVNIIDKFSFTSDAAIIVSTICPLILRPIDLIQQTSYIAL